MSQNVAKLLTSLTIQTCDNSLSAVYLARQDGAIKTTQVPVDIIQA